MSKICLYLNECDNLRLKVKRVAGNMEDQVKWVDKALNSLNNLLKDYPGKSSITSNLTWIKNSNTNEIQKLYTFSKKLGTYVDNIKGNDDFL